MRTIKFRAWNGIKMEYNIMAGWLGGFYVKGIDPMDTASMSPFNTKLTDMTQVMQFTGLLDKNGKEIYEGDVVRNEGIVGEIVWEQFGFFAKEKGVTAYGLLSQNIADAEIIGNIYENPDLLAKK